MDGSLSKTVFRFRQTVAASRLKVPAKESIGKSKRPPEPAGNDESNARHRTTVPSRW
jgi:hypothetical protein